MLFLGCISSLGLTPLWAGDVLPPKVEQALRQAAIPREALSVVVVPLGAGPPQAVRLTHQADVPRNPASLMKLVTTSVAIETLGLAHVWRTTVWADGPIQNGALRGNLFVQGQGDPKLVVERLWLLARRIRALGIDRIDGDIVLDRSAFDVAAIDPGQFDGEPHRPYNASPDALAVNFKAMVLSFVPDPKQGVAWVHVEPPFSSASRFTCASTPAACSPPITETRALGHVYKKRGEYARPHIP